MVSPDYSKVPLIPISVDQELTKAQAQKKAEAFLTVLKDLKPSSAKSAEVARLQFMQGDNVVTDAFVDLPKIQQALVIAQNKVKDKNLSLVEIFQRLFNNIRTKQQEEPKSGGDVSVHQEPTEPSVSTKEREEKEYSGLGGGDGSSDSDSGEHTSAKPTPQSDQTAQPIVIEVAGSDVPPPPSEPLSPSDSDLKDFMLPPHPNTPTAPQETAAQPQPLPSKRVPPQQKKQDAAVSSTPKMPRPAVAATRIGGINETSEKAIEVQRDEAFIDVLTQALRSGGKYGVKKMPKTAYDVYDRYEVATKGKSTMPDKTCHLEATRLYKKYKDKDLLSPVAAENLQKLALTPTVFADLIALDLSLSHTEIKAAKSFMRAYLDWSESTSSKTIIQNQDLSFQAVDNSNKPKAGMQLVFDQIKALYYAITKRFASETNPGLPRLDNGTRDLKGNQLLLKFHAAIKPLILQEMGSGLGLFSHTKQSARLYENQLNNEKLLKALGEPKANPTTVSSVGGKASPSKPTAFEPMPNLEGPAAKANETRLDADRKKANDTWEEALKNNPTLREGIQARKDARERAKTGKVPTATVVAPKAEVNAKKTDDKSAAEARAKEDPFKDFSTPVPATFTEAAKPAPVATSAPVVDDSATKKEVLAEIDLKHRDATNTAFKETAAATLSAPKGESLRRMEISRAATATATPVAINTADAETIALLDDQSFVRAYAEVQLSPESLEVVKSDSTIEPYTAQLKPNLFRRLFRRNTPNILTDEQCTARFNSLKKKYPDMSILNPDNNPIIRGLLNKVK